jgi:predicted enzyme related to lactoylglutathione lyase
MLPEGAICWVEHMSPDHHAAVAFYTRVFGLEAVDETSSFVFLRQGGADVMAAYSVPGAPRWLPYVASIDAAAAAGRARLAGGTVRRESTAVGEAGWSAWVADPEGTLLGIWQAGTHTGALVSGAPGTVCRVDLHTRQPADAERFLTGAFGLERLPDGNGSVTSLAAQGAEPVHLVPMDDRWADAPPAWLVYFGVADVKDAVRNALDAGGGLLVGPRTGPGIGDFAVLSDPLSLPFGVVGVNA